MKRVSIFTTLIFLMLGSVCGQEKNNSNSAPQGTTRQEIRIERRESSPQTPNVNAPSNSADANRTLFITSEMSLDKVVKGAPYSADAVTESVLTLADGNRIVRKTTSKIYRDAEGRTRRETVISNIGPYPVAGDMPQSITINDPVAKANYVLEAHSHIARKWPYFEFNIPVDGQGEFIVVTQNNNGDKAVPPVVAPMPPSPRIPLNGQFAEYFFLAGDEKPKRESLGTQVIEGVAAEGTRITFTIPAGKIGNERQIDVVDERWYSPDLQTVVMSKHSDPRFGETVFRLTNINRSAPDPSLFQIPSDYTVKENAPQIQRMRIEKKNTEKKESKQN